MTEYESQEIWAEINSLREELDKIKMHKEDIIRQVDALRTIRDRAETNVKELQQAIESIQEIAE